MSTSLKQRIHDGEIINGTEVLVSVDRAELESIAEDGFDFIVIDSQHTALNEEKMVQLCLIAEELELDVRFRIPHTRHTYLIGRYLDLGPTYIVVPEVEEERVVDEALDNFYYPTQGRRSWGGVTRRNFRERVTLDKRHDYTTWWNKTGVLSFQIESLNAVINAGRLAKPGIDVVNFGPFDLMLNLDRYPNAPFKTLEDCIRHVADQLAESTIRMNTSVPSLQTRDAHIALGVSVFSLPRDALK